MTSISDLKEEIERLQSELEQTTQEKVQAAEYGLAVLEEKQNLQVQYDELEGLYEKTVSEFECAKEVSSISFFIKFLTFYIILLSSMLF